MATENVEEAGLKVTYTGPSVAVDLLGPNNKAVKVRRGESIDVPDDYGKRLVLQSRWSGGDDRETAQVKLLAAFPDLSPQAAETLVDAGYDDAGAVAGASDDELNAIAGIGPATIRAIRDVAPANGAE